MDLDERSETFLCQDIFVLLACPTKLIPDEAEIIPALAIFADR